MTLRLYMVQASTNALGPGQRFALWTQGCEKRCPGCISPHSRDPAGGEVWDIPVLADKILHTPDIEGLTISGGEPFLQAAALCELIETVRSCRDLGVIIYTGYTHQELRESDQPAIPRLLGLTDLLIDGPYQEQYNDGKSLRGSSNQLVIALSERYRDQLVWYGVDGRKIELLIKEDGHARVVGIPPRDIGKYVKLEGKK
jgi:anaerobic ribonucleoside-triphosphate reductase activating protein